MVLFHSNINFFILFKKQKALVTQGFLSKLQHTILILKLVTQT
jgi:hypothetical protein